jgi:membrane protein DedA with SNARE-associated domain
MISAMTEWILASLRAHGGWAVFGGVLVEQVIIPIPSPAIIMGAGAILIPAAEPWGPALAKIALQIILPGTAASLVGAWALYYVGLYGGRVFVDRFHNYLGFDWKDVESMSGRMSKGGEAATIFFMRALPVVPLSLVSLVGGVLEVPVRLFLLWTFLGTIPRCLVLAILGWQMGTNALNWARGVNRLESLGSLALGLAVLGGILWIRRRVRSGMEKEKGGE